jgi:thioredoxin 1
MGGVVTVTDATFGREVIDSPLPVVVNFTAEWCAPCRITEPILKELSHKLEGRVKFAKVDVDEAGAVTRTYGIHSIPTYLFVQAGQEKGREIGPVEPVEFHSILKRYFDFVEPRPSRVSAGRPASP